MKTLMKKATLGLALGAAAVTAAAPADAQRYYGRGHYRQDNTGTAIVAGIAGLALGAALTSGDRYDRRYDYDRRYYAQRGYYPRDGYYAQRYSSRFHGYDRCYVRRTYDPYIGRSVRVRYCD